MKIDQGFPFIKMTHERLEFLLEEEVRKEQEYVNGWNELREKQRP
jgi:hypothetical protein